MKGIYESIQIECPKYGDKKIIVDGKELDLSKIKSIRVNVDCDGIDIDVELSWFGLPYKI